MSPLHFFRWRLAGGTPVPQLACLIGLLTLSGCAKSGPPRGTAEGKITVAGKPVTEGTVMFENASAGVSVMIPLNSDGSYVLRTHEGPGMPVGRYQVAVSPRKISNGEFPKMVQPGKERPPEFPVPLKYRSVESSGWIAEVQEGKNPPFDFDAK